MDQLYIFLISALSAGMQSALGFGYAIVGMVFFPFVLAYVPAVTLCNIMSMSSNLAVVVKYHKYVQWRRIWLPLALSFFSSTIATRMVVAQAEGTLKRILGAFLVGLAIYFLVFKDRIRVKATPFSGSVCGLLSGLGNGFFSVNGPPMVVYFMALAEEDDRSYLATIQMFFLILNIYTIAMRVFNHSITPEVVTALLPALAGVGVGVVIGLMLFKKMGHARLYQFVYLFMAVMGMIIFINA